MQYTAGIQALIGSLQEDLQHDSGTFPVNPVQYSLCGMGTRKLEGITLLVTNPPYAYSTLLQNPPTLHHCNF